jgi:hypothetical protein
MAKISREIAEKEVLTWLDFKKVSEKKREGYKDAIETLNDAVCEGKMIVEADHSLKQILLWPTEGESPMKELTYKPRLKVHEIHSKLDQVKGTSGDARIMAYVSALTTVPMAVIKQLDSEDYNVAQSVAIFFL